MSTRKFICLAVAILLSACKSSSDDQEDLAWIMDKTGPQLHSSVPGNLEDSADIDTQIVIFFDESLDETISEEDIQVKTFESEELITGTLDIRGATLIFTPSRALDYSTEYVVESSTAISDVKGNQIETPVYFRFTTRDIEMRTAESTYSPEDSLPGIPITQLGEVYAPITEERRILHEQNHAFTPLITASLPPIFEPPAMESIDDYVLHLEDLTVLNFPGEHLSIMEGKRHGYDNLTIALTHTLPGGGAPLHTHAGEESHVLLEGKLRYFLGGQEFVVEAPFIVNIPSYVPHTFMNVDSDPANLVAIFPANAWEYDILEAPFPFFGEEEEGILQTFDKQYIEREKWLREWHNPEYQERHLHPHTH